MRFWLHKRINIALAFVLIFYAMLAVGHFGHAHTYGQAEHGFCTTQCADSQHFDTKPLCKGFPINLTLGVVQGNFTPDATCPVFFPEFIDNERQGFKPPIAFKDPSRAPPLV